MRLSADNTIKDTCVNDKKPLRDLPDIIQLDPNITFHEIFDMVESEFGENPAVAYKIKLHLCRKQTDERLKTIGEAFGIVDAAVVQSFKWVKLKLEKYKKLRKKWSSLKRHCDPLSYLFLELNRN